MVNRSKAFEKLLARGEQQGYLTFDEVNEALPADVVASEEIEAVLRNLMELGIELVEAPPC